METDLRRTLYQWEPSQVCHVVTLHCAVGCAQELPAPDFAGVVRLQDLWGRCSAQIFGAVSPAMHDAFALTYNQALYGGCGLLYYGCCEPLARRIDILRRRFANLRKISITPWAEPHRTAESMGRDFVMAAKPNPAFVGSRHFNAAPVKREIAGTCDAPGATGRRWASFSRMSARSTTPRQRSRAGRLR